MDSEKLEGSGIDTGVICLTLMTQYLRQPADPDAIRHDLGLAVGMASRGDLVRAAKKLQLKARIVQPSSKRLDRLPLPAIIEKNDGSFAVLAAISADKVLLQDPQVGAAQEVLRSEFEAGWSGYAILITSRAFSEGFSRRFDFSWFVPEIIRYRWIFAEVLLASFFVQLLGLISPIFFQLVIDKVLVHNGRPRSKFLLSGCRRSRCSRSC